jgi:hypothetical protein
MTEITYQNDKTGSLQKAQGSDGRLNVSARADTRGYYNSRDQGQSYSLVFNHPAAADGEYSFYIKNDNSTKDLIISSVHWSGDDLSKCILWFVTGTAAEGAAIVPTNLNRSSPHDAVGTFLGDEAGTPITVGAAAAKIDVAATGLNGHEEMHTEDRVRLGQGDAIALEVDVGSTTPEIFGTVYFYYE